MTQMTLTLDLEDFVKPSEIKRIIKNIKGIVKVSASRSNSLPKSKKNKDEDWINTVNKLKNSVNYSDFDLKDERTRYILKENDK